MELMGMMYLFSCIPLSRHINGVIVVGSFTVRGLHKHIQKPNGYF